MTPLTFLCRWDPDDVVGQRGSLPHAVPNVVDRPVSLDVRMGRYSVYIHIVTHVNLLKWLNDIY